MNAKWMWVTVLAAVIAPLAQAQQTCANGIRVEGAITDPTGAVIPGAQVKSASGERTTTDITGRYMLPCVRSGSTTLAVEAEGFAPGTIHASAPLGQSAHVNLQLTVAGVQTEVQVGDDATAMDADHGVGTQTLNSADVQLLADDPDDFLRELQALAARGGGIPGAATITVDGFQNGSALPPKGSIASIRVNPDMFSPEYERASRSSRSLVRPHSMERCS